MGGSKSKTTSKNLTSPADSSNTLTPSGLHGELAFLQEACDDMRKRLSSDLLHAIKDVADKADAHTMRLSSIERSLLTAWDCTDAADGHQENSLGHGRVLESDAKRLAALESPSLH